MDKTKEIKIKAVCKVVCDERDCPNTTILDLDKVKSLNWRCDKHKV